MRRLRDLGCEVQIITSNSNHLNTVSPADTSTFEIPTEILKATSYSKGKSIARLVSWLFFDSQVAFLRVKPANRPDVIIASSPSILTMLSGGILAKRLGSQFVPELRDLWPITGTEEFRLSRKNILIRVADLTERSALFKADGVIGMVPGFQEYLDSRVTPTPPCVIVELGMDRETGNSIPKPIDRQGSRNLVVGYAGSVGRTNNVENLLRAASLLQNDNRFEFRIFGKGDESDCLQRRYGGLANLNFYGRIPKEHLASELQKCDVLHFSCLSSKIWEYGQSLNKVVEYMLAGRPIIASFSGRRSMINEARCGSFVEAENPEMLAAEIVRYSARSDDELNQEGFKGYTWVLENRRYDNLGTRLFNFLQEIASSKQKG